MDALSTSAGGGPPPITRVKTLEGYAEWMRGIIESGANVVNTEYKLNAAGFDEEQSAALLFGTFGGSSHYVYIIHMNEEGKCDDMVKVWNDAYASVNVLPSKPKPNNMGEPWCNWDNTACSKR